jgi:hypothetical protein
MRSIVRTRWIRKALNPLERQAARRAARQQPLARLILRTFLHQGGPIPVEDIIAASPGARPATSTMPWLPLMMTT